jgi:hypothetical protein
MAAVVRSASIIGVGAVAAQLLRVAIQWVISRRGKKYGGLDGTPAGERLSSAGTAYE